MDKQKPVHLKKKVADTAQQLAHKAQAAVGRTQSGLEEFGDEFVAVAARVTDKLENTTENLTNGIKQKLKRKNQADDELE